MKLPLACWIAALACSSSVAFSQATLVDVDAAMDKLRQDWAQLDEGFVYEYRASERHLVEIKVDPKSHVPTKIASNDHPAETLHEGRIAYRHNSYLVTPKQESIDANDSKGDFARILVGHEMVSYLTPRGSLAGTEKRDWNVESSFVQFDCFRPKA